MSMTTFEALLTQVTDRLDDNDADPLHRALMRLAACMAIDLTLDHLRQLAHNAPVFTLLQTMAEIESEAFNRTADLASEATQAAKARQEMG